VSQTLYIYIFVKLFSLFILPSKSARVKADGKLISAEEQRQNVVQYCDPELLKMLTEDSHWSNCHKSQITSRQSTQYCFVFGTSYVLTLRSATLIEISRRFA
jgi:hypothetical protein